jgi:5-methylcytosine-specific restriction enzyme A
MGLRDLTPKSMEAALGEAERLGRDAFLARYGFGHTRQYFIKWNGHDTTAKPLPVPHTEKRRGGQLIA